MSLADEVRADAQEREAEADRSRSERETTARGGPVQPGLSIDGDAAVLALPVGVDLGDIRTLLASRGLDADQWHVERVTTNEWEALAYGGGADGEPRVVTLHQLKVHLRNRSMVVGPAREVAERHHPGEYEAGSPIPRLVAVMGDQQAPYHDPRLHTAVLEWLADVQPDELVLTGDTMDLPTISRHRDRIRWNASAQECVDAAFALMSDYADASPTTRRRKLRGNHDWRLESELMDRAERMAFLAPGARTGELHEHHMYSVRRLLHMDALGYTLCGVEGEDWRHAEHALAPGLVVRHEPPAQAKAARINRTVLAGHTHRQRITYLTTFDREDRPVVLAVVEVGTLANPTDGLGYAERPDWQQGFATVALDADGSHHVDLATWRDNRLTWRGRTWK